MCQLPLPPTPHKECDMVVTAVCVVSWWHIVLYQASLYLFMLSYIWKGPHTWHHLNTVYSQLHSVAISIKNSLLTSHSTKKAALPCVHWVAVRSCHQTHSITNITYVLHVFICLPPLFTRCILRPRTMFGLSSDLYNLGKHLIEG